MPPNTDYNVASKTVINYVGEHYMEKFEHTFHCKPRGTAGDLFLQEIQKKETGISFHQYLSRIRLMRRLPYTTRSLLALDCALQAGFTSEKVMIDWCRKDLSVYACPV